MDDAGKRSSGFQLIDRNMVDSSWNGIGTTIAVNQSLGMPQTPNGTTIFGWVNQATLNNEGNLSLTSGGNPPTFLVAPALSAQPGIFMNNWQANNLNVTNISPNANTPIWVCLYGPGIPGQSSMTLKTDGTQLGLATGQSAVATALPQNMRLLMSGTSPKLCIFAIVGGPPDSSGNNGYVIAVNASANTGPNTGAAPPPGYYATTTGNAYPFIFSWGSSKVYVVNLSPATSSSAQVALSPL
jgi:hypothetical protein